MRNLMKIVAIASSFLVIEGCTGDGHNLLNRHISSQSIELTPTSGTLRGQDFEIQRVKIRVYNQDANVLVSENEKWSILYKGKRIRCRSSTAESCARALQVAQDKDRGSSGSS